MTEKNNSGILFVNSRKELPNHKDWEGNCKVDGKTYWLAGWIHEGPKGQRISIEFKLAE